MDDPWNFLEVKIDAVTLSQMGFALLLRCVESDRVLPIFIGAPEAHSIALTLEGESFPRPLTHDLFRAALEELDATVVRVFIHALEGQTFFAKVVLLASVNEIELDARPSDAVALALRFDAPILVREDVWEAASAPVEDGEASDPDPRPGLRRRLEQAIQAEDYETAARLRDELHRLDGGN